RREAGGLDGLEGPAAALHVEHVLFLAEEVLLAQLDRGVASAVQHERAVAAEQARGVDARAERPGERRRFRVAPEAFHSRIILFTTVEKETSAWFRVDLLDWSEARAHAAAISF